LKSGLTSDVMWIKDHHLELRQKYPDMYVAVYKSKVVVAHREFGKVYEKVEKIGVDAVIKYVFSGDLIVLKLNLERVGSMANKIYFSVFNPHWMASLKPVILDADWQHDAREIPRPVHPILEKSCGGLEWRLLLTHFR